MYLIPKKKFKKILPTRKVKFVSLCKLELKLPALFPSDVFQYSECRVCKYWNNIAVFTRWIHVPFLVISLLFMKAFKNSVLCSSFYIVWKWEDPWSRCWVPPNLCFPSHSEKSCDGNHTCRPGRQGRSQSLRVKFKFCIFVHPNLLAVV